MISCVWVGLTIELEVHNAHSTSYRPDTSEVLLCNIPDCRCLESTCLIWNVLVDDFEDDWPVLVILFEGAKIKYNSRERERERERVPPEGKPI